MGAATFTPAADPQDVIGNRRVIRGSLTLSDSYATGGESFDLATEVGLKQLHKVLVDGNVSGVSLALGGTASVPLLLAYAAADTEVAAAVDLDGVSFTVELHGV